METSSRAILKKTDWVSYHWFILAVIFSVTAIRWLQGIDPDLWWHIHAGNWMIDHRQLLQVDLFSSSRYGQVWQHPDWLAEILMAAAYRLGGLKGVFLFFAAIYTTAVALLMRASKTHRVVTLAVALLALLASQIAAAPKPALFSFLFFVIYLITIDRGSFAVQRIVLPLVMVLWSNMHGGFSLGFLLLGVYWLYPIMESLIRNGWFRKTRPVVSTDVVRHTARFAMLIGLVLLAALINPYGVDNLVYLARSTSVQTGAMSSLIVEWLPPDFRATNMQVLLGVIGIVFLLFYLAPRKHVLGMLLTILFLAMTLIHARMVLFWAPVVQYYLGQTLYGETPFPFREYRRIKWVVIGAAVAALLLPSTLVLTEDTIHERVREQYPVSATAYLHENGQPGNLFNLYHWGGYVQFAAPDYPVFIDGRADLFGDEIIFGQYFKVLEQQAGWTEVLTENDIRYLLIEPTRQIATELIAMSCEPVYKDEISVLFELGQCPVLQYADR